ncbi:MAG: pyruvate kinase [Aeromonas sp.]
MLSFVQYAKDVEEARSIVGDRCKLMAKIEKPTAVLDLDNILKVCDSILVARGDLAVETRISRMGSL